MNNNNNNNNNTNNNKLKSLQEDPDSPIQSPIILLKRTLSKSLNSIPQTPPKIPQNHSHTTLTLQSQPQQSAPKPQNPFIKTIILLSQILLHYSDLLTDLLFTLKTLQSYLQTNDPQTLSAFLIMTYALLYERQQQYLLCQQIKKHLQIKKIKQHQTTNLSAQDSIKESTDIYTLKNSEKALIFLYLLTFSEQILFFQLRHISPQKMHKFLFQKSVSDLCCENMFFFILGYSQLMIEITQQKPLSYLILLSTILSFSSCIQVLVQIYLKKIQTQHKYKRKNLQKFAQFPLDLQLFLTNPEVTSLLRFNQNKQKNYLEILKKDSYKLLKKDLKLSNQKPPKAKIPLFHKIYLSFFVFILLFSELSLTVTYQLTESPLNFMNYLLLGFLFHLPQLIHHLKLLIKNKQNIDNFRKKLLRLTLQTPVLMLVGCATFILPFLTYEVPFLKKTKQTWRYNYYPTSYIILIQTTLQSYYIYNIYQMTFLGQNFSQIYLKKDKNKLFIQNPQGIFRNYFYIVLILFFFGLIFKFLFLIDQVLQKYEKGQQIIKQAKEKETELKNNEISRHRNDSLLNGIQIQVNQVLQQKKKSLDARKKSQFSQYSNLNKTTEITRNSCQKTRASELSSIKYGLFTRNSDFEGLQLEFIHKNKKFSFQQQECENVADFPEQVYDSSRDYIQNIKHNIYETGDLTQIDALHEHSFISSLSYNKTQTNKPLDSVNCVRMQQFSFLKN